MKKVNPQIHPKNSSWLSSKERIKKEKENRPKRKTTTGRHFVNMYVSTKSD